MGRSRAGAGWRCLGPISDLAVALQQSGVPLPAWRSTASWGAVLGAVLATTAPPERWGVLEMVPIPGVMESPGTVWDSPLSAPSLSFSICGVR